jgi:putative salt-induced outer membrane protein
LRPGRGPSRKSHRTAKRQFNIKGIPMIIRKLLLSFTILAPAAAMADDPPPPQDVWTGKGQAGFVSSQGNTQAQSANAALDMALVNEEWKHAFHLGGLYGENAGIVAAERWDTGWQTNYDFNKSTFVFGALRYAHDMFSGFDYQASATGGLGYKVIDSTATKFDVQLGAGYRELRPEELTKNSDGAVTARTLEPSTSGAVLTFGANYSQALTGTTTLTDKLLVEYGTSDTLVTNTLALVVKISGKLALSLGYNIQNNSSPPAGLKKLDSLETVNLVYSF